MLFISRSILEMHKQDNISQTGSARAEEAPCECDCVKRSRCKMTSPMGCVPDVSGSGVVTDRR